MSSYSLTLPQLMPCLVKRNEVGVRWSIFDKNVCENKANYY